MDSNKPSPLIPKVCNDHDIIPSQCYPFFPEVCNAQDVDPSKEMEEALTAYLKALKASGLADGDISFEWMRITRKGA